MCTFWIRKGFDLNLDAVHRGLFSDILVAVVALGGPDRNTKVFQIAAYQGLEKYEMWSRMTEQC